MRLLRPGLIAVMISAAVPAQAEKLITSLSSHQVLITSSFTGTELVLFGAIERDAATVARRGGYDVVVTVKGPAENLVTRKKEHILGIWTNAQSRTFVEVPAYVAVLSNRPLDAIASSPIRQKLGIGLRNLTITQRAGISKVVAVPDDSFRTALIDIKRDHGLYREEDNAVTFLSPGLFRAAIRLPAVSPIGSYDIEINLFADGASLTQTNSALEVVKVGVEQFIASAAREHGLLYGLATTFMALATGWFAAMIFRRD